MPISMVRQEGHLCQFCVTETLNWTIQPILQHPKPTTYAGSTWDQEPIPPASLLVPRTPIPSFACILWTTKSKMPGVFPSALSERHGLISRPRRSNRLEAPVERHLESGAAMLFDFVHRPHPRKGYWAIRSESFSRQGIT